MLVSWLLPILHNLLFALLKKEVKVIEKLQKSKIAIFSPLMRCIGVLGSKYSVILIFCGIYWFWSPHLAFTMAVSWGIGFFFSYFVCNFIREILLLPRPYQFSDGIVNREGRKKNELSLESPGFPCTRVYSCVSLSLCFYTYYSEIEQSNHSSSFLTLSLIIALLVGTCRVLLGVQTISDVIGGSVLGAVIPMCVNKSVESLEGYLSSTSFFFSFSFLLLLLPTFIYLLLLTYPKSHFISTSYCEVAMVVGGVVGWIGGEVCLTYFRYQLNLETHSPSNGSWTMNTLKWAFSIALLAGIHWLVTSLVIGKVPPVYSLATLDGLSIFEDVLLKKSNSATYPSTIFPPPSNNNKQQQQKEEDVSKGEEEEEIEVVFSISWVMPAYMFASVPPWVLPGNPVFHLQDKINKETLEKSEEKLTTNGSVVRRRKQKKLSKYERAMKFWAYLEFRSCSVMFNPLVGFLTSSSSPLQDDNTGGGSSHNKNQNNHNNKKGKKKKSSNFNSHSPFYAPEIVYSGLVGCSSPSLENSSDSSFTAGSVKKLGIKMRTQEIYDVDVDEETYLTIREEKVILRWTDLLNSSVWVLWGCEYAIPHLLLISYLWGVLANLTFSLLSFEIIQPEEPSLGISS